MAPRTPDLAARRACLSSFAAVRSSVSAARPGPLRKLDKAPAQGKMGDGGGTSFRLSRCGSRMATVFIGVLGLALGTLGLLPLREVGRAGVSRAIRMGPP